MAQFKKPTQCKGCNEPAAFTFKQIEKGKTSCFGMCSKCPLRKKILDQKIETVACPSCSKTLQEVETSKVMGCIDCFSTFKETCHNLFQSLNVSEFSPRELMEKADVQELQTSLQEAIAKELFEEAALIRDKLKEISTNPGSL